MSDKAHVPMMNYVPFGSKYGGARYGIEIEIEGQQMPHEGPPGWRVVADGSLRNGGVEFVTKGSVPMKNIESMLKRVDECLAQSKSKIQNSIRCSVHVHMNVMDLSFEEIGRILVCYYIVEDLMCRYAGRHREGNLFCLRLSDTQIPMDAFIQEWEMESFPRGFHDDIRYSALNLLALKKYGSLEFRAYRGIDESALEAMPWINMINNLRSAALEFPNRQSIINEFSGLGPEGFVRRVIGDGFCDLLYTGSERDQQIVYDSMRRAQWLAFYQFKKMEDTKESGKKSANVGNAGVVLERANPVGYRRWDNVVVRAQDAHPHLAPQFDDDPALGLVLEEDDD